MLNFVMQVMKSGNPEQLIMSRMTPQQKQIAQNFLNSPNRAQALEQLKKDYNVSDDQINGLKNALNR